MRGALGGSAYRNARRPFVIAMLGWGLGFRRVGANYSESAFVFFAWPGLAWGEADSVGVAFLAFQSAQSPIAYFFPHRPFGFGGCSSFAAVASFRPCLFESVLSLVAVSDCASKPRTAPQVLIHVSNQFAVIRFSRPRLSYLLAHPARPIIIRYRDSGATRYR